MVTATEALFAPLGREPLKQRLCLWHAPTGAMPRRLVVHVHGFGEDLNKSRRMAALQARALAHAGDAVLRFDLLGCGDSDGDFSDATWDDWIADTVAACHWALAHVARRWPQAPMPECWLWGHRAGCLLAQAAAAQLPGPWHFLFWQPTPVGKTVLQQFLRLDIAAAKLAGATDKASAKALLAAGTTAEVAGYEIAPALAAGLEAARLQPPAAQQPPLRMEWLDVSPQPDATPPPATKAVLEAWQAAGCVVGYRKVIGSMFWQTTEIEDAPALVEATCEAITSPAQVPAVA